MSEQPKGPNQPQNYVDAAQFFVDDEDDDNEVQKNQPTKDKNRKVDLSTYEVKGADENDESKEEKSSSSAKQILDYDFIPANETREQENRNSREQRPRYHRGRGNYYNQRNYHPRNPNERPQYQQNQQQQYQPRQNQRQQPQNQEQYNPNRFANLRDDDQVPGRRFAVPPAPAAVDPRQQNYNARGRGGYHERGRDGAPLYHIRGRAGYRGRGRGGAGGYRGRGRGGYHYNDQQRREQQNYHREQQARERQKEVIVLDPNEFPKLD